MRDWGHVPDALRSLTKLVIAAAWVAACFVNAAWAQPAAQPSSAPEPQAATLSWVRLEGAETCISSQALARAVEARVDRPVFVSATEAPLSVEGYVAREADGYRASLTLFDATGAVAGKRELQTKGEACDELSETATVVLAVMLDPEGARAASPAPEPKPAAPPPLPTPPEPPPEPAPPPAAIEPQTRTWVGFGYRHDFSTLPGDPIAADLSVQVRPKRYGDFELRAAVTEETSQRITAAPGARALVRSGFASAAYCFAVEVRAADVASCAGLRGGVRHASTEGLDSPRDQNSAIFDATLGGRARARLFYDVWLEWSVTIVLPVLRTALEVDRSDGSAREVYEPDPVGASFGVMLLYEL